MKTTENFTRKFSTYLIIRGNEFMCRPANISSLGFVDHVLIYPDFFQASFTTWCTNIKNTS